MGVGQEDQGAYRRAELGDDVVADGVGRRAGLGAVVDPLLQHLAVAGVVLLVVQVLGGRRGVDRAVGVLSTLSVWVTLMPSAS